MMEGYGYRIRNKYLKITQFGAILIRSSIVMDY